MNITMSQTEGLPFLNGGNSRRRIARAALRDALMDILGPKALRLTNRMIKRAVSTKQSSIKWRAIHQYMEVTSRVPAQS